MARVLGFVWKVLVDSAFKPIFRFARQSSLKEA
jgi:hypothetical protein